MDFFSFRHDILSEEAKPEDEGLHQWISIPTLTWSHELWTTSSFEGLLAMSNLEEPPGQTSTLAWKDLEVMA